MIDRLARFRFSLSSHWLRSRKGGAGALVPPKIDRFEPLRRRSSRRVVQTMDSATQWSKIEGHARAGLDQRDRIADCHGQAARMVSALDYEMGRILDDLGGILPDLVARHRPAANPPLRVLLAAQDRLAA